MNQIELCHDVSKDDDSIYNTVYREGSVSVLVFNYLLYQGVQKYLQSIK